MALNQGAVLQCQPSKGKRCSQAIINMCGTRLSLCVRRSVPGWDLLTVQGYPICVSQFLFCGSCPGSSALDSARHGGAMLEQAEHAMMRNMLGDASMYWLECVHLERSGHATCFLEAALAARGTRHTAMRAIAHHGRAHTPCHPGKRGRYKQPRSVRYQQRLSCEHVMCSASGCLPMRNWRQRVRTLVTYLV